MLEISDKIKVMPVKKLKPWVEAREKENRNSDWKDALAKLKESYAKGTGKKCKQD